MSKEIYISTTPHETRLAIVEDEQLAEIYFERENEYTLAGSIYNGKVTRVLPGMQSSFVDVGLERDAFLYVTDFMEEQGDAAEFDSEGGSRRREGADAPRERGESRDRSDAPREKSEGRERGRNRRPEQGRREPVRETTDATSEIDSTVSFEEPIAPAPNEPIGTVDAAGEGSGSRRWRGRRGRRRGRGTRDEQPETNLAGAEPSSALSEEDEVIEGGYIETMDAAEDAIEIRLEAEPAQQPEPESQPHARSGRDERRGGRDRKRRGQKDRGERRDAPAAEPAYDNSYAGYYTEEVLPEASGEPVLLPGESIRKYRDPAQVAAEDAEAKRNAPSQPEILTVSAPAIQIVGWDGGAVLPGESLGRHRGRENRGSENRGRGNAPRPIREVTPPAESFDQPEPMPAPVASPIASEQEVAWAVAPEEPTGLTEHPAHGVSQEAVEAAATADLGALPGVFPNPGETETPAAEESGPVAVSEDVEYEPQEGASASVGDSTRRDLRRFEQVSEPSVDFEAAKPFSVDRPDEIASEAPDQTTYDLNAAAEEPVAPQSAAATAHEPNLTVLQASGEMLSLTTEPSEAEPQIAAALPFQKAAAQDAGNPSNPVVQEGAVQSVTLSQAEAWSALDESNAEEEDIQPGLHAYGEGDFNEEEIEEDLEGDEFEYQAATAAPEDGEPEDYEEETLDEAADLGAVVQEMSLDRATAEEGEPEDASGGFTAEDFGEEEDDDEQSTDENGSGTQTETRVQHDPRRQGPGGRDRRNGRHGGERGSERGRGRRQSMQTTDLPAINELLKPGQEILVQIAKEPIAKKGARITSHIALPGRFLVFMPTVNHTGVSRKISSDEERRRLKSILLSEKGDAQGGFIVRTAADGASEEELRNDLRFLIHLWTDIKTRSESSKSPALIYHDLNLVERILRDQVTDNFSAIWVDTEQEYERVLRFLQRFQPALVRRVKLYTKETPLFEHFGVTQEIDKALKSKVWLKSGGSIVIDQTEALVAIDINTGKYVGKTARLEDTILKTNLDSIPEIVRQIRLRDLGGIIVIDFIDMDERKNRAKVLQALEDEMRADRAPSKILPFNDFGLVIMTRKRVKQSLERTLCMPDPITDGTGMIKSPVTIANDIYVEMRKMYRHLEKADVMLRVHPEVVKTLKANGGKRLQELEEMTHKTILVKSDPALSPEAFDIH